MLRGRIPRMPPLDWCRSEILAMKVSMRRTLAPGGTAPDNRARSDASRRSAVDSEGMGRGPRRKLARRGLPREYKDRFRSAACATWSTVFEPSRAVSSKFRDPGQASAERLPRSMLFLASQPIDNLGCWGTLSLRLARYGVMKVDVSEYKKCGIFQPKVPIDSAE